MDKVQVSVIIPILNEEKNIPLLYKELKPVLEASKRTYEVIFIEDGSSDSSWQELEKLSSQDSSVKIIQHGKNLGLTQVYQNGFDHSTGEYVLTLASDLENNASDVLRVIEKLDEGFDVVNTNRVGRWQEKTSSSLLRSIPSKIANWMIADITGVTLKDNGSGLKGFRRFVLDNLRLYGEMHRFFASMAGVYTKKITEIEVQYKERVFGKSNYGSITRTIKVFLDLFSLKFLVSLSKKPYSLMPGRLFGSIGLFMLSIGMAASAYLVSLKLFFGESIGDRPLLIFSVLLVVTGTQLVMTGLIGELLMRVYFETGERKIYSVRKKVNF